MSAAAFGLASGSITLTFQFRARANQDVGAMVSMSAVFPGCDLADLSIVLVNSAGYPVPNDTIVETVCSHVMNSNLASYWSPPNAATPLEILKKELEQSLSVPINSGASRIFRCDFNGQFGPLLLAYT